MRKFATPLLTLLFLHNSLYGSREECFHGDFFGGYREDRLTWEISDPIHDIDPLSKLTWENLRIWEIGGSVKISFCDWLSFRCWGNWGRIYDGDNTDSDYNEQGIKFLESKAKAGKGEVWDLSGGLGYEMACNNVSILPLIGFSIHEQHLYMYDGVVTINDASSFLGPFDGLNSSYKTRWYGPWVGVEFIMAASCSLDLYGEIQWHVARYHAAGHWNLREDMLDDFRHRAWGHGWVFALGLSWPFCNCWSLNLEGGWQLWRTKKGTDTSHFITQIDDEELEVKGDIPLEHVKWDTWNVRASIAYWF